MSADTWQSVYRSLTPRYSTATLTALCDRIEDGEQYAGKRLIHGVSTEPPPLWAIRSQRCEGACLIAWLEAKERYWTRYYGNYSLYRYSTEATVSDVEGWFAEAIGTLPPGVWPVLGNWWDNSCNTEAAALVRAETLKIIEERNAAC